MKFNYIVEDGLFYKNHDKIIRNEDGTFNVSDRVVANALGALLYMPATMNSWCDRLLSDKLEGATSIALDLEDALEDEKIEDGIKNIIDGFKTLVESEDVLPFIFVRVRNSDHMTKVIEGIKGYEKYLTGFILPKFSNCGDSVESLRVIKRIHKEDGFKFYVMPILEDSRIMKVESRVDVLLKNKALLDSYKEYVLNVRVGATDFTSLFGIRRNVDNTVYDLSVVRNCLADIINIFGRNGDYVLSGPVFEFFNGHNRMCKPMLREHLFVDHVGGLGMRKVLIDEYIDGLVKEVSLDKINGFVGKTIIHPSHIKVVNSLLVVSYEEYMDALDILSSDSGVSKSVSNNKMNERKPHRMWAERILDRASAFGVLNKDKTFVDIILN